MAKQPKEKWSTYKEYSHHYAQVSKKEDERSPVYFFTRMIIPSASSNLLHIFDNVQPFLSDEKKEGLKTINEANYRKLVKIILSYQTIHFLHVAEVGKGFGIDNASFEKRVVSTIYYEQDEQKQYIRGKGFYYESKEKGTLFFIKWLCDTLEWSTERDIQKISQIIGESFYHWQQNFQQSFLFWTSTKERKRYEKLTKHVINYYEVLGIKREATKDEIVTVYKQMMKIYHPDLYDGLNKEEALQTFYVIQEAYETLSDTEKRKSYEKRLDGVIDLSPKKN